MDSCLFCKIVKGEIPADIVYQDDNVIAFEDLHPQMPVHTLVIPKQHFSSLNDDIPVDVLGHVFQTARTVAELKGIDQTGYRVIVNTGEDAGQTVHHLHIHVLGGDQMNTGDPSM